MSAELEIALSKEGGITVAAAATYELKAELQQ